MRYLAICKYKGTSFCGWQKQSESKLPSIQDEIERVFKRILNKEVKIYGSGRTDAGVHALGQTFHFDVDKELDIFKFKHGVNELISPDVVILSITKVNDDFHARFNAISKTYVYKIVNTPNYDPFYDHLAYQLKQPLDIKLMKKAAKIFLGEHNFQNFTSKEEDDKNFVRLISKIKINKQKDVILISLTGNGFMRYMVRMIVGNLIQVGLGKLTIENLKENLENKQRKPSSYKAPSDGLYLKEVCYK